MSEETKKFNKSNIENVVKEDKDLKATGGGLEGFEDFDVYGEINIFDNDNDNDNGKKLEEKTYGYSAMFNEIAKLDGIKNGKIKLDVTPVYKNKDGFEHGKTKTIEFNIKDGWLKNTDNKFVDMSGNVLKSENDKIPKGAIEARRCPAIISAFSRPEHGLGSENIPGIKESGLKTFGKDIIDGLKESLASFRRADGFWNTTGAILYSGFVRPSKYAFRKVVNGAGKVVDAVGKTNLGKYVADSKFGQSFKKYVGLPLKKAYKNVFDNRDSETLTGTFSSVVGSGVNFIGETVSRIVGIDEEKKDNIGIDKNKISYLAEANENNSLSNITNGKISLTVRAYYKDRDFKQILSLNSKEVKLDISNGYLRKENENNELVYCDINGNEVNEKNKVEACRESHMIDIFCRPGKGLGPENIPRPEGEFFLKTFIKDVGHEFKGIGRDFINADSLTDKVGSVLHSLYIRPIKFIGRQIVNVTCKFCDVTGISKSNWGNRIAKSDFGQGIKAGYKSIFDNPRNNNITGTIKAVGFSVVGRPIRYGYRKLIKPGIKDIHDAVFRFFKGRNPEDPDKNKNELGKDKKNRPKYEIKLIKKPRESKTGGIDIAIRVFTLEKDNLTGKQIPLNFEDRVLTVGKDGYLRDKNGNLCDFKGNKVENGIEACRDSHILKAFSMSGNGLGPENIPKSNDDFYVLKDIWDGVKGLIRPIKETKIPVLGNIYNAVAITWRAPLKIAKYTGRSVVNLAYKLSKESGLLDSEIAKQIAKTDLAHGIKASYKNIFDNYQKDTVWETTKAVAFSLIGRPIRYTWKHIKTPIKKELKTSYEQFKDSKGFLKKANVVLGYPIKFMVKCPIKIAVKAADKVFTGIGIAGEKINKLTNISNTRFGQWVKKNIADSKFGKAIKSFGKGTKNSYKALIDTPENDTFTGTLVSIGRDVFYKPVRKGIDAYKNHKENNDKTKSDIDINEEKENKTSDPKIENNVDMKKQSLEKSKSVREKEDELKKIADAISKNKIGKEKGGHEKNKGNKENEGNIK